MASLQQQQQWIAILNENLRQTNERLEQEREERKRSDEALQKSVELNSNSVGLGGELVPIFQNLNQQIRILAETSRENALYSATTRQELAALTRSQFQASEDLRRQVSALAQSNAELVRRVAGLEAAKRGFFG